MIVEKIVSDTFQTNTYIINKKIVIDPASDFTKLIKEPVDILLTHGHFDHILGLKFLKLEYVYIHPNDCELLKDYKKNLSSLINKKIEFDIECKDITKFFEVIHTPGHTMGSCAIKIENYLFTGDTLFTDSIGRTDFPGSSEKHMFESLKILKDYLKNIPEDTIIAPGHGPMTSVEKILINNPYLRSI
ncbi:hypothetical protein OSSY52_00050 [Tepiditoga spiralis]|uniref:Metallo-beta-lactamase domain-containing protein n=1 Tax=Tepiditoga spiralis TaxID=2108365 RepID=A0A7G1G4C3_9BACT|nr:MBL fold metallo-hydrolase [Tepiditoga spiralis]BBE29864.1 hypothetical protein OSSY52_00050 [Tepiditoga spiralis]